MNWKELLQNRKIQMGIVSVVILAILIALLVSSCNGRSAQLVDPLGEADEVINQQLDETSASEPEETEEEETKPEETKPEETEPEETEPEDTEPEETEPEDTEPEETEPKETKPKETEPEETKPEETEPKETKPEETEPEETTQDTTNTETDGQEENQGSEGGTEPVELALELGWKKKDGSTGTFACAADKTYLGAVENYELDNGVFTYTLKLVGTNAGNAQLISAKYSSTSGETGSLNVEGGSITFKPVTGTDTQTYYLSCYAKVQIEDQAGALIEKNVTYNYTIVYTETLDVQLSVKVEETNDSQACKNLGTVTSKIKNNQLSAGAVNFEIALTGEDGQNGRILSVTYTSESGETGTLQSTSSTGNRYNLRMTMPEGKTSNAYTVTVKALVKGQNMQFAIKLDYSNDVTLELRYNNGTYRSITCENGKTRTAADVYDDQLVNGVLPYSVSIVGSDAETVTITDVSLYQSGSGRQTYIPQYGEVELLLKDGLPSENTFRIGAKDNEGKTYQFTINIPYKHKGTDSIQIDTNLADGQTVTNEFDINLWVSAYSPYAETYLPATSITVMLDGNTIAYASSAGEKQEYTLCPANPEVGDTNTHTLYIYAEDAYGNYGSKTLTLNGQRAMTGQKKGTATIRVDLSVLGLGVDSITCDVLVNEPVSYTVYKAMTGNAVDSSIGSLGAQLGAPSAAFGYGVSYGGTLDNGFYLSALTVGQTPTAMTDSVWPGSTEEEILAAIDEKFGEGTPMAALWRCIYRNGLNKSGVTSNGTYAEHDFAQGSGWMYSINGSFPGQSMSALYLEDGDVLTLHYTLAYGWDIGAGTPGYGNTVGYCVTARGGSITVNHNIVENIDDEGVKTYTCSHCGWEQECEHEYGWKLYTYDNGGNGCIQYCTKCNKTFDGTEKDHQFVPDGDAGHKCSRCGTTAAHNMTDTVQPDTATCQQTGTKITGCTECDYTKTEETPVKDHTFKNTWYHTETEHYRKCTVCKAEFNHGTHRYDDYDADWEEYYCSICGAGHEWDYECYESRTVDAEKSTCKIKAELCECGNYLYTPGTYEEYHHYNENGVCTDCGAAKPCSHANVTWVDVDDGTRKQHCSDCDQDTGVTCDHTGKWSQGDAEHTCSVCGKTGAHTMEEVSNTATCTEAGILTEKCTVCQKEVTADSPAKGHSYTDGTCGACGEADPDYDPSSGDNDEDPSGDGGENT